MLALSFCSSQLLHWKGKSGPHWLLNIRLDKLCPAVLSGIPVVGIRSAGSTLMWPEPCPHGACGKASRRVQSQARAPGAGGGLRTLWAWERPGWQDARALRTFVLRAQVPGIYMQRRRCFLVMHSESAASFTGPPATLSEPVRSRPACWWANEGSWVVRPPFGLTWLSHPDKAFTAQKDRVTAGQCSDFSASLL